MERLKDKLIIAEENAKKGKVIALSGLHPTTETIRKKLTQDQVDVVRQTAVGHLFGIEEKIKWQRHIVHGLLLRKVKGVDIYNMNCVSFLLGERFVRFTKEDFCLITGLRFGNIPNLAVATEENTPLSRKYFCGGSSVNKWKLLAALEKCKDEGDQLKLALVVFIECCLLRSEKNKSMDTWYLTLVENLEDFNCYPCGTIVFERTRKGLYRALRPEFKRHSKCYNTTGVEQEIGVEGGDRRH